MRGSIAAESQYCLRRLRVGERDDLSSQGVDNWNNAGAHVTCHSN